MPNLEQVVISIPPPAQEEDLGGVPLRGYSGNSLYPTIQITGLNSGNLVKLYYWASDDIMNFVMNGIPLMTCSFSNLASQVVAIGNTAVILTPTPVSGNGGFYSYTITDGSGTSACFVDTLVFYNDENDPSPVYGSPLDDTLMQIYNLTNTVYYNYAAPQGPSSLSMVNPAYSIGSISQPTIRVGGVNAGDTVNLYSRPSAGGEDCANLVATGVATGSSIDLTLDSPLQADSYIFTANKVTDGTLSACSSGDAYYNYRDSIPVPNRVVANSLNGQAFINSSNIVDVYVEGVVSGDAVTVYTDSNCTAEFGQAIVQEGNGYALITASLPPFSVAGNYNFYATASDGHLTSSCSTLTEESSYTYLPNFTVSIVSSDTLGLPVIQVSGVFTGANVVLRAMPLRSDSTTVGALMNAGFLNVQPYRAIGSTPTGLMSSVDQYQDFINGEKFYGIVLNNTIANGTAVNMQPSQELPTGTYTIVACSHSQTIGGGGWPIFLCSSNSVIYTK